MIKEAGAPASAFHFLFHAEGRVTPGQGGRLGVEREREAAFTYQQACLID